MEEHGAPRFEGIPPYRSEHRHWEEVARWRDEQLTESREIGGT
jgi:hypothetical protein